MSVFRDDWDRKAHDIICIVKYGNPGGSVATKEMHRVSDILRGESFKPPIVVPPLPVKLLLQHDPNAVMTIEQIKKLTDSISPSIGFKLPPPTKVI